jgi:hypothetical protein
MGIAWGYCGDPERRAMSGTKLRFGFRSKKQLPLFMLWREYWEDGVVVFAHEIFSIDWPRSAAP